MQNLYTKYTNVNAGRKFLSHVHYFASFILNLLFPPQEQEQRILELKEEDLLKLQLVKQFDKNCIALFPYQHPTIKHMVWLLKYRDNAHVSDLFAKAGGEYLTLVLEDLYLFSNFKDPLLIPMPISPARLRERGFNQTERIAEKIVTQFPYISLCNKNVLIKYRESKPQTTLPRKDRLNNVKNTLKGDERAISGRNIILLDDVITTGSTMKEARETLRKAGAKNILCVALAH